MSHLPRFRPGPRLRHFLAGVGECLALVAGFVAMGLGTYYVGTVLGWVLR